MSQGRRLKVGIVGPCGVGKTTLAQALQARGYDARQIAQEHSFVPDMWQQLTRPDVLIFLDGSFETCNRRKPLDWRPSDHAEQLRRLAHAREHCDIYVDTDGLSAEEVLERVLAELGDGQGSEAGV